MNNAIGAKNQKNFILFLIYTDIVSAYMYVVVAWHMVREKINKQKKDMRGLAHSLCIL